MKAILRVTKHSEYGSISSMLKHVERKMEVLNADPSKSHKNVELLRTSLFDDLTKDDAKGNRKYVNSRGNGLKAIKGAVNSLKEKGVIVQKNSVKVIDHLMTASPEFFKKASQKEKQEFLRSCYRFLADTYGDSHIVSMHLHQDERTPHIHAFVIPCTTGKLKSGREVVRLSAKHYLGGREKMREMQTNFHSYVKHLGLERGNENSKAKHTTIKKYYSEINNIEKLQEQKQVLEQELKLLEKKKRSKDKGFGM